MNDLFGTPVVEPPAAIEPAKLTEADFVDRLRTKYGKFYANGEHQVLRYVGAAHVRYGPLWPSSIADFLVQDTWGNYGLNRHPILGFEIKTSRSDYLRELRDLQKSAPFRAVCSEWYIVAPFDVVRDDLPDGWGFMHPAGDGLRTKVRSAVNHRPEPMPRGLIAGFLRAAVTQARNAA